MIVNLCACGDSICSGTCREYSLNQCTPIYNLCTGASIGYAFITQSGSTYTGTIYSDSACQINANTFSVDCGQCATALLVEVPCPSSSGLSTGAIIGIAVGGGVGLLVLVGVGVGVYLWFFRYRRPYEQISHWGASVSVLTNDLPTLPQTSCFIKGGCHFQWISCHHHSLDARTYNTARLLA